MYAHTASPFFKYSVLEFGGTFSICFGGSIRWDSLIIQFPLTLSLKSIPCEWDICHHCQSSTWPEHLLSTVSHPLFRLDNSSSAKTGNTIIV